MDLRSVDELLSTTRSVRRRLDLSRPVERATVERCIELAVQAPTGSNSQTWHFVVVTDPVKRAGLADLYRRAWAAYAPTRPQIDPTDPRSVQMPRVLSSASYLAEHFHEVPMMIIPCLEGRFEKHPVVAQASRYGSILPATWSLMLALRSRGIGSAWTTLHLVYEREAAAILGIPETVTQAALLTVGYYTGDGFRPARRIDPRRLTHWNGWGER